MRHRARCRRPRAFASSFASRATSAAATSSASTKLIKAGSVLREPRLGRCANALRERDLLLAAAPHIVRPMRFVLPHRGGRRHARVLGAGLFLSIISAAAARSPPPRAVSLGGDRLGATLQPDCSPASNTPTAPSTIPASSILNAMDARTRGAEIRPRVRCVIAEREGTVWRLAMEAESGERYADHGADAGQRRRPLGRRTCSTTSSMLMPGPPVRLVKGSHIVVPKLYDHDRAYVLQNADGRIIFVIPYQHDFTLIGTTEEDYHGDPAEAAADSAEIAYLIAAVGEYFRRPIFEDDVVWAYSGVRPLPDRRRRRTAARRHAEPRHRYRFRPASQPPLVTILGGRITTYRRLAEDVLDRLAPFLKVGKKWTAGAALPGGLFPVDGLGDLIRALRAGYPFLAERHAERLAMAYGTRAQTIVSRRAIHGRSRRAVRRRPDRGRGPLPDGRGMGRDRRGHPLAADEARPPLLGGRGGGPRGMAPGRPGRRGRGAHGGARRVPAPPDPCRDSRRSPAFSLPESRGTCPAELPWPNRIRS